MYALFGFLGILLLLAGLLPIRVLPGFLRGRPRKERRAMWVSGLIIVLIAGAFTPSDDESQQEVASNESRAATTATTSESRAATTTEAPLATLDDAAPADATTIPSIESTTSTNASPTAPTATAAATTSTTGATSTTAAVTTTVAPTTTSTTTTTTTTAAPTTTTTSGTSYTENDIEYKLAVVDKGGFVPLDDPVIKRYEQALDALEPKCTESRTLIADQSVRSVQLLADSGVVTNALEVLRAADDSIPPELGETRCSEIFAVLIVLMQG